MAALEFTAAPPTVRGAELHLALGRACHAAYQLDDALGGFRRAAACAIEVGDLHLLGEAAVGVATATEFAMADAEIEALLTAALDALPEDAPARIELLAGLARTHRPRSLQRPRRHQAGELWESHVPLRVRQRVFLPRSQPALRPTPPLVDPSPWAAPWVFFVNFRAACDMHDAGYDGGIVLDPRRGYVDTRALSRRTIDDRFYDDLINSCNAQIGWNAPAARGAVLRDRQHLLPRGARRRNVPLRADPAVQGTQFSGTRPNN